MSGCPDLGVKLTSMDVELISDLSADLSRSDVLFTVQCVHHLQLLLLHQLRNDFNAVPLRQPFREQRGSWTDLTLYSDNMSEVSENRRHSYLTALWMSFSCQLVLAQLLTAANSVVHCVLLPLHRVSKLRSLKVCSQPSDLLPVCRHGRHLLRLFFQPADGSSLLLSRTTNYSWANRLRQQVWARATRQHTGTENGEPQRPKFITRVSCAGFKTGKNKSLELSSMNAWLQNS